LQIILDYQRGAMRTFINTCGIVVIVMFLVSFAMKNAQPVEVSYYFDVKYTFPAWGLVLGTFFMGVVFGNLLDVFQRLKLKNELRKIKREMQVRV